MTIPLLQCRSACCVEAPDMVKCAQYLSLSIIKGIEVETVGPVLGSSLGLAWAC